MWQINSAVLLEIKPNVGPKSLQRGLSLRYFLYKRTFVFVKKIKKFIFFREFLT